MGFNSAFKGFTGKCVFETENYVHFVTFCMDMKLAVTLIEEHRLREFKNRVLSSIFGTGGDCRTRSLMICTPHQILFL
jgi:hypothetical protein